MKVLIVDDAADVRKMLKLTFGMNGHSVVLAENGMEAVEAAQHEQFDAVLMDIEMPILDGWKATELLRLMPGYSTLPIILFTGYTQGYDAGKAQDAGATLLLHKPIDPSSLVDMTVSIVQSMEAELQTVLIPTL